MDDGPQRGSGSLRKSLVLEQRGYAKEYPDDAILGVVKESQVSFSKASTIIKFETEEKEAFLLCIKNNAGFLTGQLVLYNTSSRMLSTFIDESYQFAVVASIMPSVNLIPTRKTIKCPECDSYIPWEKFARHLINNHWFSMIG